MDLLSIYYSNLLCSCQGVFQECGCVGCVYAVSCEISVTNYIEWSNNNNRQKDIEK